MKTLENLVRDALADYDLSDYLDEFFAEDIDWIRSKFEPVIKSSLEKFLQENGKEILKDCLAELVNEQVTTDDVDKAIKELVLEHIKIDEIIKRIFK